MRHIFWIMRHTIKMKINTLYFYQQITQYHKFIIQNMIVFRVPKSDIFGAYRLSTPKSDILGAAPDRPPKLSLLGTIQFRPFSTRFASMYPTTNDWRFRNLVVIIYLPHPPGEKMRDPNSISFLCSCNLSELRKEKHQVFKFKWCPCEISPSMTQGSMVHYSHIDDFCITSKIGDFVF